MSSYGVRPSLSQDLATLFAELQFPKTGHASPTGLQQTATRPRTTCERAGLEVGEVQVGVDRLGGDDVGVVVVLALAQ